MEQNWDLEQLFINSKKGKLDIALIVKINEKNKCYINFNNYAIYGIMCR